MICTTANNHLLIWNAGASNDKGLDAVFSTLDSITALAQPAAPPTEKQSSPEESSGPMQATPEKVRVSSGIAGGLLLKKVNPVYPAEARQAFIQGTVILQAQISKSGDIVKLELVSGPIELAGSAVTAVRQWKYRPYMLKGESVVVDTQVQVNYELRSR
jgi:TonB family protein